MKTEREFVSRIKSHYVGEDCIQIMTGYIGGMIITSPKETIFHDQDGHDYVHKYVEDERRKQFPYSNIPVHNRRLWGLKWKFANQLLDFDTPYLRMSSEGVAESYAVKDGKQALLVNKAFFRANDIETRYLTRKELEEFFTHPEGENEKQYIMLDNRISGTLLMPREEVLVEWYKERARSKLLDMVNNADYSSPTNYRTFDKLINNATIEDIPEDFAIARDIIMINTDNENITMRKTAITFMDPDRYRVDIYSAPITKYTLEQLKGWTKIYESREPKIRPRINPNIKSSEIADAKRMIKEKK